MSKEQCLEIIKLLSALESLFLAHGKPLPDYLHEQLCATMNQLTTEVLK